MGVGTLGGGGDGGGGDGGGGDGGGGDGEGDGDGDGEGEGETGAVSADTGAITWGCVGVTVAASFLSLSFSLSPDVTTTAACTPGTGAEVGTAAAGTTAAGVATAAAATEPRSMTQVSDCAQLRNRCTQLPAQIAGCCCQHSLTSDEAVRCDILHHVDDDTHLARPYRCPASGAGDALLRHGLP